MKWNVIIQDSKTGNFKSYNIFEYPDFESRWRIFSKGNTHKNAF